MTTEMPVLFNGTMVRAILGGAKTITRRPVVPMAGRQRQWLTPALLTQSPRLTMCRLSDEDGGDLGAQMEHPKGGPLGWVRCPLGAPGDRLWVRESWCAADTMYYEHDQSPPRVVGYLADRSALSFEDAFDGRKPRVIPAFDREQWNWKRLRGRPSIHMPRWASRLSLDVVSVGVERVQDITEDDARREGIEPVNGGWGLAGESWSCGSARGAFQTLWDLIGGDGAWRENPWVWRVEFTRAEGGR
jgi:hypothetical protein